MRNRLILATSALAVIVWLWGLAFFVAPRLGAGATEEVEFGSASVYTVPGGGGLRPHNLSNLGLRAAVLVAVWAGCPRDRQ